MISGNFDAPRTIPQTVISPPIMNTQKSTVLNASSIQSRLGLCAAALAGTAAAVPTAEAAVVTFNVNASVPMTLNGLYINFVTGTITGAPAGNTGWDFNPYSNSGPFAIYWSSSAINGGVTTGPGSTTYANLTLGTVVGASSNFSNTPGQGTSPSFTTAGSHIMGFRFLNEATGATNYGYMTINSGSTGDGFPITIQSWSFENSGGSITVVPEPSTTAMLTAAALVLGALGLRKWRRQQAA